jgi:hypothetical protein
MTSKLLLPSFRIWSFRAFQQVCYSSSLLLWMEGRIWGGGWRIGISVVEGCQTDRLLVLLVLHTLVLHPSFLVVQSEKGDGTMTKMQNLYVVSVLRV